MINIDHREQRTNNVLESYNAEYGKEMGKHPNLFKLVEKLEMETNRWVLRLDQAKAGKFKSRQERAEIEWPTIPYDFEKFKEDNAAKWVNKQK